MDHGAAVGLGHGDLEEVLPAGHRRLDLSGVERDAGCAPVLRHGVGLAVDDAFVCEARRLGRGVVIRQLRQLELVDEAELHIGGDRVVGGNEEVPTGAAGLELRQHFLVGAEDIDLDGNAGCRLEGLERRGVMVVRPGGDRHLRAEIAGEGGGIEEARLARENCGRKPEAGDAEEVAARNRAALQAHQFVRELIGGDRGIFSVPFAHDAVPFIV
ncbi:hypothetical protein D9M70_447780 [compost metagenome]